MADLEEMGYIIQPHTSAGRIPSDKGYRLYVDMLMEEKEQELNEMQEQMLDKADKMDQLLKQAARVLATNTNYATMVSAPVNSRNTLKFIQLSQVDQEQIVAAKRAGNRKNYLGKSISSRLEEAILNRKTVLARPGEKAYFSILENTDNTTPLPELIFPILSSGDAIGSVILCGKDRESLPGDTEKEAPPGSGNVPRTGNGKLNRGFIEGNLSKAFLLRIFDSNSRLGIIYFGRLSSIRNSDVYGFNHTL
mgnify:CR=1 FL=1